MALYPTDGDLVNEKIQALNAAVLVWRAIQRLNAGRLSLAELAELDLGADVIEALYCREAAQGRRQ